MVKNLFSSFLKSESSSGWLLLTCIALSLLIANSPAALPFNHLLTFEVGGRIGSVALRYPVLSWINDGLMAAFFLLVGLEVKRALLIGELASFRKAALPVFAALGGCIIPAILFGLINAGSQSAKGWAIPMATDIAFALAILSIAVGNRARSVKTFLSTLAIADDIFAILVIAVFYSSNIHTGYLLGAAGVFAMLLLFNRIGIKSLWCYIIPGILLWYLVHHSGIHATIAGVLIAIAIPLRNEKGESPLEVLEHALLRPVNFLVMPLFAIANTNITFTPHMLDGLTSPLSIGIAVGLLLGKPLGVMLLSFIAVRLKVGALPADMTWKQVMGVGILAGIGFTMSIFVAMLSYGEPALQVQAKFAILLASTIAGVCGYLFIRTAVKR